MIATRVIATEPAAPPLPESDRVFELIERTGQRSFGDITYYLRMPSGWDGEKRKRDIRHRVVPNVRGVLALCTHRSEAEEVRPNVLEAGRFKAMVRWADEQNPEVIISAKPE